jgi:hypothetical protein
MGYWSSELKHLHDYHTTHYVITQHIMFWMKAHYGDPFWGVTLYYFQICTCLIVSHFKLLKDFHNIFAYIT